MTEDSLADTAPDNRALPAEVSPPTPAQIDVSARTHPGAVRSNNEDNFHVVQFGRYLRTVSSSLPDGQFPEEFDRPGYGLAVADGMGGHAAGEVASRAAIALFIDCVLRTPDWIFGRDPALLAQVMERTAERFRRVNESFLAQARDVPGLKGMGTTLSMAISLGDDLIVAHVGDSPVYLLREGRLHRLTKDHTVAQERRGFDPDAARFRNVLTRAIGIPEAGGGPDVERYRLADGDRLLLCTDGLPDMVGDEDIARELGQARTADDATRRLIELALAGGGRDNVTAVVASYRIPTRPPG